MARTPGSSSTTSTLALPSMVCEEGVVEVISIQNDNTRYVARRVPITGASDTARTFQASRRNALPKESTMNATVSPSTTNRYAKVVEISKRVRWEIERDVIRGRAFDFSKTFLPRGLSLVDELPFLSTVDSRALSQVQGRTYANLFGLVERFIAAKMLQI